MRSPRESAMAVMSVCCRRNSIHKCMEWNGLFSTVQPTVPIITLNLWMIVSHWKTIDRRRSVDGSMSTTSNHLRNGYSRHFAVVSGPVLWLSVAENPELIL